MRVIRPVVVLLFIAASSGGCAAIGLAVIGTGLGVAAGTGTAYTLDGIAYRTFAAPIDRTRGAALRTLRRMDITVQKDDAVGEGRAIVAAAGDRTVYIDLEKLTSRTTRMRVTAKQGWFWRDRSTAGEIVAQTADAIDESPSFSQRGPKS